MKYCINCGKALQDTAKFCSQCGTRQEEAPDLAVENRGEVTCSGADDMGREDLLSRLEVTLPLLEQVQEYQKELNQRQKELRRSKRTSGITTITQPLWDLSIKADELIDNMTFGIFGLKKRDKEIFGAYYDYSQDDYQARYDELKAEVNRFLLENMDHFTYIPEDYRYPMAVSCFIKYLNEKRAHTMPELLNLYDEQLHRWKMEDGQNQIQQQLAWIDLALLLNGI